MIQRWIDQATHRSWLDARFAGLMGFVANSRHAAGGFEWLDADGSVLPGQTPQLFLTGRMAHVAAIATLRGVPGSQALLDHAIWSLTSPFADAEHGGWHSALGVEGRKQTYAQMFVALGASSAIVAGSREAEDLLDRAIDVINTHLWDDDAGALVESFANDWTDPEPYRGANANMHGVEAMLAVGDVTGDAIWHERALRVAERLIDRAARDNGWVLPEHFDEDWNVQLDYNRDRPADQFRPYGSTPGHSLEWARLMLALHASPVLDAPAWCLEAARELIVQGLSSWGVGGHDGLPYTLDWEANPVVDLRLHWPVCEAIQATALYDTLEGAGRFEGWYRRLWDHVVQHFMDPSGTWANELSSTLERTTTVWPGRVDVYHIAGAYVGPQVGASPFVTLAVADRLSRLTENG